MYFWRYRYSEMKRQRDAVDIVAFMTMARNFQFFGFEESVDVRSKIEVCFALPKMKCWHDPVGRTAAHRFGLGFRRA